MFVISFVSITSISWVIVFVYCSRTKFIVCLSNSILWPLGEYFLQTKPLVTGWLLKRRCLHLLFITAINNTLRLIEMSFKAWPNMATISAVFCSMVYVLRWLLCISQKILRGAFMVLIRNFCIDINFVSFFRCQHFRSFHSSELTLGVTNTPFSGDLYFSTKSHALFVKSLGFREKVHSGSGNMFVR